MTESIKEIMLLGESALWQKCSKYEKFLLYRQFKKMLLRK